MRALKIFEKSRSGAQSEISVPTGSEDRVQGLNVEIGLLGLDG